MRFTALAIVGAALLCVGPQTETPARGFGAARGGAAVGQRGAAVGGARGGSYTGPRGTTVQAGRAGGVATGPFGGVHAGGVQGARVTTPGGQTFTTGSRAGATVGPAGGVRVGGAHGAATTGPWGAAAGGWRGGVAVGPYGAAVGGARGVAYGTRYVSPTALRSQGGYVRGGYSYSYFTPAWYRTHRVAWVAPRWRIPNIWVAPAWPAVAVYCGITAAPVVYDYGSTVVIENNNVYINGEPTATAEEYAAQATSFADAGRQAKPAENEEWQPLGVFGLVQGEEKVANHIFQLAVNKAGVIRGNYYDALSDSTQPVYGSVDRKSQRAAWSIGEKQDIVYEAGLNNLTQDQTTVLVHFGKERTEQMVLVRLEEPKEGAK
jgi:hypothetical protein